MIENKITDTIFSELNLKCLGYTYIKMEILQVYQFLFIYLILKFSTPS